MDRAAPDRSNHHRYGEVKTRLTIGASVDFERFEPNRHACHRVYPSDSPRQATAGTVAKRRSFHVPDVMRPAGGDRIWKRGRALSGDHGDVSIFYLQRLSPAPDARGPSRNGDGSGDVGFSGSGKGSVSRRHRRSHANEGYAAAELRKSGFATLTYDSFAARGTTGAAMSATPGYLPSGVADAYAALRQLANEPRIDASRIAIIG